MRKALQLLAVLTALAALAPAPAAQEGDLDARARAALLRAGAAFRSLATEGGYLWRYSLDLSRRAGEVPATATQIWVQPPGTPAVGRAFLRAHAATAEASLLEAAVAAGHALARGQLACGCWDYHIDFDPRGRPGKTATFDDDVTQSALRFLLALAQATRFGADERLPAIRAALRRGLAGLLRAQYPSGAWPQRWDGKPHESAAHAPLRASFPERWSRTWKRHSYGAYYTFNDHAITDCLRTALAAWKVTGQERFREALERGAEFILRAQLPDPQPVWAQQYDFAMHPAWARRFEPPAACSAESRGVAELLLDLYLELGDARYLAAAKRAARWFERSAIAPGRWARFHELRTNRPLYCTRRYELVYHDRDLPEHYSFQGAYGIPALIARTHAIAAAGRGGYRAAQREERDARALRRRLAPEVRAAVAALDERGRWVSDGNLESRVFIRRAELLARYLEARPRDPGPPSIVFILADDLGWGDLGCYGQKVLRTPRLDHLAAQGMRFTDAYAGSTVCAPSRCVLMTGKHTGHARIRSNARIPLLPADRTVAEVLRERGYTTGILGKWGLGEPDTSGIPNRQGFDEWFGYLNQGRAHNYYPEFLWRNSARERLFGNVASKGIASRKVTYSHDLFTTEALSFLERHRRERFFLYLAYTLPHANNELGRATGNGMEVPSCGPFAARDWPAPERGRAAMIARLDRDVGRLLDKLAELDLAANTLVIFTSDNGPHREGGSKADFFDSNGPLRGIKRDLYEGGIRVPAIARWPGKIPAGASSAFPWGFQDVLPTLAEIAGAQVPAGLDGESILAALRGEDPERVHPLYWEFPYRKILRQALRSGRWKAVRPRGAGGSLELYDLAADLGESRDLAAQHPEIAARLARLMDAAHQ